MCLQGVRTAVYSDVLASFSFNNLNKIKTDNSSKSTACGPELIIQEDARKNHRACPNEQQVRFNLVGHSNCLFLAVLSKAIPYFTQHDDINRRLWNQKDLQIDQHDKKVKTL